MRCNSKSRRTGGVIVYLKRYIKYEIMDNRECELNLWTVILNCIIGNVKKRITTMYHSPGASDADFLRLLEKLCNKMISNHSMIVGEFNIDLMKENVFKNG